MALNPIAFAEEVNKQFFRYQLTAFPLSDPDLYQRAYDMPGKGGAGAENGGRNGRKQRALEGW